MLPSFSLIEEIIIFFSISSNVYSSFILSFIPVLHAVSALSWLMYSWQLAELFVKSSCLCELTSGVRKSSLPVISLLSPKMTAFSIVCCSSLMLPGHLYESINSLASSDRPKIFLLYLSEYPFKKSSARGTISSFLLLSGGIVMWIVFILYRRSSLNFSSATICRRSLFVAHISLTFVSIGLLLPTLTILLFWIAVSNFD